MYCRMKGMLRAGMMKRLENRSVFFFTNKKEEIRRVFLLKYFYFESNIAIAERCGFTERKALMFLHISLVVHGCKLLFVFKLYCRIFSKKLCGGLVWIYIYFSYYWLLKPSCWIQRERKSGIYTVSSDFGSVVQYVLSIWIRIF